VHLEGIDAMDKPTRPCDAFREYLRATGQPPVFIIYVPDSDAAKKFMTADVVPDVHRIRDAFRPVLPRTLRGCLPAIVKHSKNNVILCPSVDPYKADLVIVIDPRTGEPSRTDVEDLARLVGFRYNDDFTLLIPPESVREIIEICIDCCGSMRLPLAGEYSAIWKIRRTVRGPLCEESSRLDYVQQIVASVSHLLCGFQIPCLLGFLAFESKIAFEQPFAPLGGDYESVLDRITLRGGRHLWDALEKGLNNLRALTAERGYPNVQAVRILVFADGLDSGSHIDKVALANH
jgi:hypothetical protein